MSIVLEDLKQRDRRIRRERLFRRLGKFAALMSLVVIGVAVATPVAYRNGYDAGKEFEADRAKPTCRAPEAKATTTMRDKFFKACAEKLRADINPTK